MTWGSHCHQCGMPDCRWVAGPLCEGGERLKAFGQFAPAQRQQWPIGTRWLARIISAQLVQLESENEYWRKISKKEFDDIRLMDVNIKPTEFSMLVKHGVSGLLVSWMLQSLRSLGAKSYIEVYGTHPVEGSVSITIARISGEAPGARAHRYEQIIRSYVTPRPADEWNEDIGPVLWWYFDEHGRVTEPPYVGTPLDSGQTVEAKLSHYTGGTGEVKDTVARSFVGGWPGYHTHFTRIPEASLTWKPPEAPPVNDIPLGSPA